MTDCWGMEEQTNPEFTHLFKVFIPVVCSSSSQQYLRTATQDPTADAAIGDEPPGRKVLLGIKN